MDSKNNYACLFAGCERIFCYGTKRNIYGVLLNAEAEEGAEITVTAAITPAATAEKDKNEPLVIEKGDNGYIIPLTQTYEGYDSVFVQTSNNRCCKRRRKRQLILLNYKRM